MSRSYCTYDEDWHKRKSVLIRSLFHDIPIMSPVEEESNDSSCDYYIPTRETFPSPPRPYSPLPPLIIETVPITNKHDEPEEFYRKLHKRIKRIYRKLFIEKRNLSSIDLDSNYNDSSINDDSESSVDNIVFNTENNAPDNNNSVIEDREARSSSASAKSNGYGADFESMDTAIIDVINRTDSNEDVVMISEEKETDSENIDEDGTRYENDRKSKSIANDESKIQTMDDDKEDPQCSTTDNQDTSETEESIEAEIEQRSSSDKEVMDKNEMIETIQSNTVELGDANINRGEQSHNSVTNDQEMTESGQSNEEDEQQTKAERNSCKIVSKSGEFEKTRFEEEKRLGAQNDELMEEDVETSQSSEGPYFKQITTEALIHSDVFENPGDRESTVYEDSVKSVILPTRSIRVIASRNVKEDRIEVLAELEENADPKTASTIDTDENETTEEELKEVTTPLSESNVEPDEPGAIEDEEDEDEEMSASQSEASDREEPKVTGESEEWTDIESDDTDEENEEIVDEPNDGRPMRLSLSTILEDDGEINSHHTGEDFEVDVEETGTPPVKEMSVHQPASEGEAETETIPQINTAEKDFEGEGEAETSPQIDAPEEDFEVMSPTQLDPIKEYALEMETAQRNTTDEEIKTPTPDTNEEEMRSSQTEATREQHEPMLTSQQSATEVQVRSEEPESTEKEMNTPPAATDNIEDLESPHSIELMRTPRPDLSHGTIPRTHGSDSASTGGHTALLQELTDLTLSIQDGADTNMSELQTSNDMNEILTSIFNESQNKDGSRISGRKRKLVDKSVQAVEANRVTWEEIRANFFIGTPKIFRLCACTDHVCS